VLPSAGEFVPAAQPFLLQTFNQDILDGATRCSPALRRLRVGLTVFVCFEGLLFLAAAWAAWEWLTWFRLQWYGVPAAARVLTLDASDDGEVANYHVYYEVPGHERGSDAGVRKETITENYYRSLKVGASIPVLYFPESPAVSRLVEDDEWRSGPTAVLVATLLSTIPFGLFLCWYRRRARLLQNGVVLDGKLLLCNAAAYSEGGYHVSIVFGFRSPTGRILDGRASALRDDLKGRPLPQPDSKVAVLYLDDGNYQVL
jgi:hypothetical protein